MKNKPDAESNINIDLAWKNMEKRDFQGAIKIFQELHETHDDDASLYGLGCSLLRKGDAEQAVEMFDKLLERDKNNFKVYHMRALSHGLDENYAAAMKDFEKALELADEKQELWCDVGGTLMVTKNYKKAAQMFQKAVDNDGRCYEAWMGKALAAYFNKEQKAALEFLNISLKLNPKNILALLAKAEIFLEMGKVEEVEKELKKILAIDSKIFEKAKDFRKADDLDSDDREEDEDGNRSDEDEIEEFDLDD